MQIKGYACIFIAACLWAIIGPVAKLAFSQGVSPLEVAFWRCVFSFIPFAVHALAGGSVALRPKDRPAMVAFSLLCVATFFGVYQLAVREGGAALASVLMYTAPAWVAIMARMFLGEAMTGLKLLAVAATMAGVAGVSGLLDGGAERGVTFAAVAFGLLSGVTYALYYIFGKRFLSHYRTPVIFFHALPLGALVLLPFVDFAPKNFAAWTAILTIAFVSTYGAYSVYYAGLKNLEATKASITATVEPVMCAVLAFAWWGESFTVFGYAGSLLILSSVGMMIWEGRRQSRKVLETTRGATVPQPKA